ncbi:MAG: hypothetical protein ABTQ30_13410 [Rhizobiaceae bacterium]
MAIDKLLIDTLGKPLAKFLIRTWLGDPAATVGGGLIDIVSSRFGDHRQRKKAERLFEDLGEQVAERLLPLFELEARHGELNPEAVIFELQRTLEAQMSPALMLRENLDPAAISAALKNARLLPSGHFSQAEEQLYARALDESVRYLVNAASSLPKFEEKFATESLDRLGRIQDDIRKTLDIVQSIEQRVQNTNDEAARYEADYRQALIRRLDYLELFGADITPESKRHSLSVAYVSLGLGLDEEEQSNVSAQALFARISAGKHRLLIRGDAGMGKSTLLRWAAISAAQGQGAPPSWASILDSKLAVHLESQKKYRKSSIENFINKNYSSTEPSKLLNESSVIMPIFSYSFKSWFARIPFLLRLRESPNGTLPQLADWATVTTPEVGEPPHGWVKTILQDGRGLVLIDGVDEVSRDVRDGLKDAITRYVENYPDNLFIVSSRPAAIEVGWLSRAGFIEATINPMSSLDRELFIDRWHDAVAEELAAKGQPQALSELSAGLKNELTANPPMARLSTNPLLCAMICALHRDRSQKLPESQSELCEALCHMLLHRRERESGLPEDALPQEYRALDYPRKRALMVDLGASMVRNNDARIDHAKAEAVIADTLRTLTGSQPDHARVVMRTLIERSGILREPQPGAVEFIHNTFKEFLAADWFVDKRDDGLLVNNGGEAGWQPVLLFAAATRSPDFASQLVRRLLERAGESPTPSEARLLRTLALKCGAVAVRLDPELQQKLSDEKKQLFPPRTMAEAEAIASIGEAAVDFLRRRKVNWRVRAACVRALRLIGGERAQSALKSYLYDDSMGVIAELAQAIDPLQIPLVIDRIKNVGYIPEGIARHVVNILPIADLGDLQVLHLRATAVTDLSPLHGLAGLQVLELCETPISDLSPLAGLRGLKRLSLERTMVADLSALESLTGLEYLDLSGTFVSDLSPVAGLAGLQVLDLGETPISDLSPLAGLRGLKRLSLERTMVADLSALESLTGLEYLNLSGTLVSDLSPVAGLVALRILKLSGTAVSDLSPVARLVALEDLNVSGTAVSNLSLVTGLVALQNLSFSVTAVSDLSPLAGLVKLRWLHANGTAVSDLSPISELLALKSLNLNRTAASDLSPLAGLTALQILSLNGTPVMDLSPLAGLTALQSLSLIGTKVSDLSPLGALIALERLYLQADSGSDFSNLNSLLKSKLLFVS